MTNEIPSNPQIQPGPVQVLDVDNILWNVQEARATTHGFDLFFGFAVNALEKSARCGKPLLVATPQLKAFWDANPNANEDLLLDLPASRHILRRLRHRLCSQQPEDFEKLFAPQVRDLRTLTPKQFARRYGISVSAARRRRFRLLRGGRPTNWWVTPEFLQILTSDLPMHQIAGKLGVSINHARYLCKKACRRLNKPLPLRDGKAYKRHNWWHEPRILQLLTSSLTERAIAEQLNISASYVSPLRTKARLLLNIQRPKKPILQVRPKDWWRQPDILQLLTSGIPGVLVAEKLGISSPYALKLRDLAHALLNIPIVKKDIQRRPKNWWQEPEPLQVLMSNISEREIADKLGIAAANVARLRNQARIHLNLPNQNLRPAPIFHQDRPADWWTKPEPFLLLTSNLEFREIAGKLEISEAYARTLRKKAHALLRQQQPPLAA
jgi:transposase-like protein